MTFLDTTYKKKSAVITSLILALFILSLFVFGLRYFDPPKEFGIAVNFGTSDFGQGDLQTEDLPSTEPSTVKEDKSAEEIPLKNQTEIKEDILTQTNTDAPISANKTTKNETKLVTKKMTPIKKVELKPDKSTTDVLSNLINGPKNLTATKTGEGTDTNLGNKGQIDGDLTSNSYYGKTGKGSGGNYNLGGRKPISKPIPIYDCNEEGIVVVRIEVDNSGSVISANAGVKGTTNSTPCLLQRAKEAALKTTWQSDINAPNKQIGSIIYNFSISN